MSKLSVNEIIPSARHLIKSFISNLDLTFEHLPDNVMEANAALTRLEVLFENFHNKIERYGAPPLGRTFLDGHLWLIQLRCFGDRVNPKNCGRWFIKVSVLYCVTLAANVDLE
jgi:hypothetical protein